MKWLIPAKTFLLGEYAAVANGSAIVLTTTPYFELTFTDEQRTDIHPESPAGLFWQKQPFVKQGLHWHDPYHGIGGVGASSAQFLACYLAAKSLTNQNIELKDMLNDYYQNSWSGKGLKPSGYDVIAQSQYGCVYINKQRKLIKPYDWPFKELAFLLLHTGIKLATHVHLQETTLPIHINTLSAITDEAKSAFETADSSKIISCVNRYHQELASLNYVAEHSLKIINSFKAYPEILAVKGCGALGADVLLVITERKNSALLKEKLLSEQWSLLATDEDLTNSSKNYIQNCRL